MLSQYRVLARKYRPSKLNELIGQETLIRVLTNAISSGRVAHGYLFTGIRGVGKTTTARIIARALNCVNGPTSDPCGVCEHCTAIMEDRHMDVLEMDAASRTGVGDVREIIENAKYLPSSARYKIYIIDEVHMLSGAAFNALLKTLEEPPSHVKFLFATTEIRKIPVTILSRCQRFDLKRIQPERLVQHLKEICEKESVEADEEALAVIVRASEGSVRDSLSLLDQAIALGDGSVRKENVASMLGLADRSRIFALFESIADGDSTRALSQVGELSADGADGAVIINDLMELTAFVTRFKFEKDLPDDKSLPDFERKKATELAAKIPVSKLSVLWQALTKSYSEVRLAPNSVIALQMVMVRLCYLSNLPSIEEVIASAASGEEPAAQKKTSVDRVVASGQWPVASENAVLSTQYKEKSIESPNSQVLESLPPKPGTQNPNPKSFDEVAKLFAEKREMLLHNALLNEVALKSFANGEIELYQAGEVTDGFALKIAALLAEWTGGKWNVRISSEPVEGVVTLGEIEKARKAELEEKVKGDKLVQQVLESYPGSVIRKVKVAS